MWIYFSKVSDDYALGTYRKGDLTVTFEKEAMLIEWNGDVQKIRTQFGESLEAFIVAPENTYDYVFSVLLSTNKVLKVFVPISGDSQIKVDTWDRETFELNHFI